MTLPTAQHQLIHRARVRIRERADATLDEQVRIACIPAPTGAEQARGDHLLRRFAELGLDQAGRDAAGNVLARLPRSERTGRPVVLAAHLDTVFTAGTELRARREDERLLVPGIVDNARGLAALLALADALQHAGTRLRHPVWLVGTVGEEGIGNLRGVRHLFEQGGLDAAAFVALDGAGLNAIVHRAVGSHRLRLEIRGQGGHSWGDQGAPNPLHALGAAIAALRVLPVPAGSTLTVARAAGGSAINAIPEHAWLELDVRSAEQPRLPELVRTAEEVVRAAVEQENGARRAGTARLRLEIRPLGERPAGRLDPAHPLVLAAVRATRTVGGSPVLTAASTDANIPLARGVPALALGAGGRGGATHTLDEWYSPTGGSRGVERALLTLVELDRALPPAAAPPQAPGVAQASPATLEWSPTST